MLPSMFRFTATRNEGQRTRVDVLMPNHRKDKTDKSQSLLLQKRKRTKLCDELLRLLAVFSG